MSRSRRRVARLLSAIATLSLLGALLPASAAAMSVSVAATSRFWDCTYNWQWKSVVDHGLGVQNAGTFDHCFGITQIGTADSYGRIQDGDSRYDTYIVELDIDWETTTSYLNGGNPMQAKITSSVAGISYAAGPTTITSSECRPFSVSLSYGGFGVSTTQTICNNTTLKRVSVSSTSAQWSATDVKNIPHMELTFMIKVNQGVKPKFTATTTYPYYTKFKDGGMICGHGYCVPTWGYTAVMYGSTWVRTAP